MCSAVSINLLLCKIWFTSSMIMHHKVVHSYAAQSIKSKLDHIEYLKLPWMMFLRNIRESDVFILYLYMCIIHCIGETWDTLSLELLFLCVFFLMIHFKILWQQEYRCREFLSLFLFLRMEFSISSCGPLHVLSFVHALSLANVHLSFLSSTIACPSSLLCTT